MNTFQLHRSIVDDQKLIEQKRRDTYLPFKLHQFFSQTGAVYATLGLPGSRYVTLEPGLHHAISGETARLLFPHVFSRALGCTFICLRLDKSNGRLLPREFSEGDSAEKGFAGYFIPGDEKIWNEADDLESLPDSWVKRDRTGHLRIAPNYATRVPVRVFVEKGGTGETSAAYGVARDEAMKQAGVKFKNWLTSRNENLRPSHQAAEEQTVGVARGVHRWCDEADVSWGPQRASGGGHQLSLRADCGGFERVTV